MAKRILSSHSLIGSAKPLGGWARDDRRFLEATFLGISFVQVKRSQDRLSRQIQDINQFGEGGCEERFLYFLISNDLVALVV